MKKPSSPDADMADILTRAAHKQFYLVTPAEMSGLRREEIKQLHLARLAQQQSGKVADKGGAPSKLPRGAAAEIKRRIGRGEVKIPGEMKKKYPGVMHPRSWQRYVRQMRGKAPTKPRR